MATFFVNSEWTDTQLAEFNAEGNFYFNSLAEAQSAAAAADDTIVISGGTYDAVADVEGKEIIYQIDGNISAGSVNVSALTINMASENLDTAAAVITLTGDAYTVVEDVKTRTFDYGNLTFVGGTRPGAVIVDGSLYVNGNMIYNNASYTAETTVIDLGGATIAANYAASYDANKNAYSFNTDTTINNLAKQDATAITVFSGSHTASSNAIRLQNDVLIYGATLGGTWHLAPGAHTKGTHTVWIVDSNIGAHYLTYNTTGSAGADFCFNYINSTSGAIQLDRSYVKAAGDMTVNLNNTTAASVAGFVSGAEIYVKNLTVNLENNSKLTGTSYIGNGNNGSPSSSIGSIKINGNLTFNGSYGSAGNLYAGHFISTQNTYVSNKKIISLVMQESEYVVVGNVEVNLNNFTVNNLYGGDVRKVSAAKQEVGGYVKFDLKKTTVQQEIYGTQGSDVLGGITISLSEKSSAINIIGFNGGYVATGTFSNTSDNSNKATMPRYLYDENGLPTFDENGELIIVRDYVWPSKGSFSFVVYNDVIVKNGITITVDDSTVSGKIQGTTARQSVKANVSDLVTDSETGDISFKTVQKTVYGIMEYQVFGDINITLNNASAASILGNTDADILDDEKTEAVEGNIFVSLNNATVSGSVQGHVSNTFYKLSYDVTENGNVSKYTQATATVENDVKLSVSGKNTVGSVSDFKSVEIAAGATLTIIGEFNHNGTITIDASQLTGGIWLAIDANSVSANAYKNVTVTGEGVSYFVDGADLFIYSTAANAQSVVYLNEAYTGEAGTKIADGVYVGINAFATLDAAKAALSSDGTLVIESDVTVEDWNGITNVIVKNGATITTGVWDDSIKLTIDVTGVTGSAEIIKWTGKENADFGTLTFEGGNRAGALLVDGSLYVRDNMIYNDPAFSDKDEDGKVIIDLGGATFSASYGGATYNAKDPKQAYSMTSANAFTLTQKDSTAITVLSGDCVGSGSGTHAQFDTVFYDANITDTWHLAHKGYNYTSDHTVTLIGSTIVSHYLCYQNASVENADLHFNYINSTVTGAVQTNRSSLKMNSALYVTASGSTIHSFSGFKSGTDIKCAGLFFTLNNTKLTSASTYLGCDAGNGSSKGDGAYTINGNIEFTMNGGTSNSAIYATHGTNTASFGGNTKIRATDYIVNGSSIITFNNADINKAVYGSDKFNISTNSNVVTGAIVITGNTTTFDADIYGNQGASVAGGVSVVINGGTAKNICGFAGGETDHGTHTPDFNGRKIYQYVYDEEFNPIFNEDGTFKIIDDAAFAKSTQFYTFVYSDIVVNNGVTIALTDTSAADVSGTGVRTAASGKISSVTAKAEAIEHPEIKDSKGNITEAAWTESYDIVHSGETYTKYGVMTYKVVGDINISVENSTVASITGNNDADVEGNVCITLNNANVTGAVKGFAGTTFYELQYDAEDTVNYNKYVERTALISGDVTLTVSGITTVGSISNFETITVNAGATLNAEELYIGSMSDITLGDNAVLNVGKIILTSSGEQSVSDITVNSKLFAVEGDAESVELSVSNATTQSVYGGGSSSGSKVGTDSAEGFVGGTIKLTLTNSTVETVYGGGYSSETGEITLNISGSTCNKMVYGGNVTNTGSLTDDTESTIGDVALTINGGEFKDKVVGGSRVVASGSKEFDVTTNVGNVTLNINGGDFADTIFGAGYVLGNNKNTAQLNVAGVTMTLNDMTITNTNTLHGIYAGGLAARGANISVGTVQTRSAGSAVNITVNSGKYTSIYGGGWAESGATVTVYGVSINVTGGEIANLYGGGNNDQSGARTYVDGDVLITISGGKVDNVCAGAKFVTSKVKGSSTVRINGEAEIGNLCGLSNNNYDGVIDEQILDIDAALKCNSISGFDIIDIAAGKDIDIASAFDLGGVELNIAEQAVGWDVLSATELNGLAEALVTLNGQEATWNGSMFASTSYTLTVTENEGKKSLIFGTITA